MDIIENRKKGSDIQKNGVLYKLNNRNRIITLFIKIMFYGIICSSLDVIVKNIF